MSTIRISKKDGRTLLLLAEAGANLQGSRIESAALDRLRAALKPRSRPMPVHKKREVADKRAAKNAETDAIRAACVERANGLCEACVASGCTQECAAGVSAERGHLDHYFGRGKVPQKVENCWFICPTCDHQKTNNRPNAAYWLELFIVHALRHGYANEAAKARRRLESLALSAQSAEAGKGGGL